MMKLLLCAAFLALAYLKAVDGASCISCKVVYRRVGCFKDKRRDRALEEQLINERDKYSNVYNNILVQWNNYGEYLPSFACRCAEAAKNKGYKYFGLQFWGECWSGPSTGGDPPPYDKHGAGEGCYNSEYKLCAPGDYDCVGDNNRNFVYEIVTTCPQIERVGCYKDHGRNGRTLDQYILSGRDTAVSVNEYPMIDWANFNKWLPDFICRCAEKAEQAGHDIFGIQYWGECWTGSQSERTYYAYGQSALSKCDNECYEDCQDYNRYCTGHHFVNAVYRIRHGVSPDMNFSRVGCFEDIDNQALSVIIFNSYYPNKPHFIGVTVQDFDSPLDYLRFFANKCARRAWELGYKVFGVSDNGVECWSGPVAENAIANQNPSAECLEGANQTTCLASDQWCYGEAPSSTFVYNIYGFL